MCVKTYKHTSFKNREYILIWKVLEIKSKCFIWLSTWLALPFLGSITKILVLNHFSFFPFIFDEWIRWSAKLARMKQAKDEAEKEMEEYRSRLEEEYQTQISGVISTKTRTSKWAWFLHSFFTFYCRPNKKLLQNV